MRENNIFKKIGYFFMAVVLIITAVIPSCVFASRDDSKVVTVAYYEKSGFTIGGGELANKSGYGYEYLQKIASYTGWTYKYIYGSQKDLYFRFINGEIDLFPGYYELSSDLDVQIPSKEMGRDKFYIYRTSYSDTISSDLSSINGTVLGVPSVQIYNSVLKWLDANELEAKIIRYDDEISMKTAAVNGEIDGFVDYSTDIGKTEGYVAQNLVYDMPYYLAVGSGRDTLLQQLNDAIYKLDALDPYYLNSITDKYYENSAIVLPYSNEEIEWLEEHDKLVIGCVDDYLPYSDLSDDGIVDGIVKDAVSEIMDTVDPLGNIEVQYNFYPSYDDLMIALKNKLVDVAFPSISNLSNSESLNIRQTNNVVSIRLCLIYKDTLDIDRIKNIAVSNHSSIQSVCAELYYPNVGTVTCSSAEDCLKAVINGKAACTLFSDFRASYFTGMKSYSNLKTVDSGIEIDYCFTVNRDDLTLLSILDRGIAGSDKSELNSYMYKYIQNGYGYTSKDFIRDNSVVFFSFLLVVGVIILYLLLHDAYQTKKHLKIENEVNIALQEKMKIIESMCDIYYVVYQIDLVNNTYTEIRSTNEIRKMTEDAVDPQTIVNKIIEAMVYSDTRDKLLSFANINNWKSDLKNQNHIQMEYRGTVNGWGQMNVIVSERDFSGNVTKAIVAIASIDEQKSRELNNAKELEQSNSMIFGLSQEYNTVWFLDSQTMKAKLFSLRDSQDVILDSVNIFKDAEFYDDGLKAYIEKYVIEEERRHLWEETRSDSLWRRVPSDGIYSVRFTRLNNGVKEFFQICYVRVKDESGIDNFVFGFRNIDRIVRSELDQQSLLKEALLIAEHANKSKTSFLNNMSHDIRTPMNAIIGFTNLATEHIEDTSLVSDYLSKISTSSKHLLSLINDVLDMSRIESGKVVIDGKRVYLPDVIEEINTIVHEDMVNKQLNFELDYSNIEHKHVECDKLRLNQVLLNIVGNAMKFTKAGGNISLTLKEVEELIPGYANFEFRIKDTGIGMSEEFQKHIFEPFERESTSTVSGIQGTGLGMSITKSIVDLMGGSIEVSSKLGEGTEFVIHVQFEICEEEVLTEESLYKKKRALVVADDVQTCETVCKMLVDMDYLPSYAKNLNNALERIGKSVDDSELYDVIFVDYGFNNLNGIDTVSVINDTLGEKEVKIVLIVSEEKVIAEQAEKVGVSDFLTKPFTVSNLNKILDSSETEESGKREIKETDFEGKKILLVEDNELNREIAVAILSSKGFVIDTAEDGDVAVDIIAKASEGQYDLILMDIQMPRMNGYEATKHIRALKDAPCSGVPIIAMTANAFEEDKKNALKAGMNGHVAKPIDIDNLISTINEVM